eukprot:TRINITY_DN99751_c0_g1_i1.p1 TRINITY_DN99751_c0_g1~~TRINITY_DN99751_c0_g1_i1.p1  ORF type:complete len:360 (+),score=121.41 TRINITY_DN99751_c0_g1_i1:103-1182(+)
MSGATAAQAAKGMSRTMSAGISRAEEFRERMIATLDECYPGIRDHEANIQQKAQRGVQQIRENEHKYWAWQKKMKEEVKPNFKLPEDSYAGKKPAKLEIMEKAEKGQRALREKNAQYEAWLQDMKRKQEERMAANLQDRKAELQNFAADQKERDRQLNAKRKEEKAARAEKSGRYWEWLAQTKEDIQKRPPIAPLWHTGSKSVEELTSAKREALTKDFEEKDREYQEWLATIQKPKFSLPHQEVHSVSQRDALIAQAARKGQQKLSQTAAEYKKWVKEMEEKKKEAMMEKVRQKLQADKDFEQGRELARDALQKKMQEAKKEQDRKAEETRSFLKGLEENMRAKPLLLEQVYRYGRVVY